MVTGTGSALYLDGSEDYITIPQSPSLRVTTHTVELWFKTNGAFSQSYTGIIRTTQSKFPYSIALTSDKKIGHSWYSEKKSCGQSTPVCIEWGQWHHLAITNDGKLSSIYVDGELKKQTPTEGVYDDKNLSEIVIGKHRNQRYPIEFKGWITEVRLWNNARSGEEIKKNMSRCLSGKETGLVGYWPLVGAITANNIAIDKSPNKNNGKIHGASITNIELPSSFAKAQLNAEERWANQNQIELNNLTKAARTRSALYLDGNEDYITIPQSPSLRVTTHTVELWFKTNGAFSQSYTGIIRTTQSKYPYYISLTSQRSIYHSWYSEKTSHNQTTAACIKWSQWHHLAITNDGKMASIYVDGELQKQTPTEGVYDDKTLSEILIGKYLNNSYPIEFKGWITEVRLWNKARSQEEIKENMSRCLSGNEKGLVGYWPLVKALTASNIAIDKSPNENNGKINGAGIRNIELPLSFAKAQLNAEERWANQNQIELNNLTKAARTSSALYLDGSEDYITIPDSPSLRVTTHTVELWFKTNGAFSQRYTKIIRTTQSKHPYSISLKSDRSIYNSWYSEKKYHDHTTAACIQWGQWHHVAITNDGKLSSIYVDGELQKQTPTEGIYDDKNLSEIVIGKHSHNGYPIEFKGWITEVRLWNKARSQEEIKENMSRCLSGKETGLVGYWPLVGAITANNIAIDKSPNENNGKINGASIANIELPSSFAKAQLNTEKRWANQNQIELNNLTKAARTSSALYLDGSEDYITIPDSPSLRVTTHTVELWFKTNGAFSQSYTGIIRTTQSKSPYSISLKSNKTIYHVWYSEKKGYNQTTPVCIEWGQWHHLAITNDGKMASIYVDGELQKQTPTEAIYEDKTLSEILIGKIPNESYPIEFKGWITEVRLWNKARSGEEIKDNMSRCLSGNETGLVGYWPLVKALTASNIAIDKSQNKNNGKINGASIANIELPSSLAKAQLNAEERWAHQNQDELNNRTKAARTRSALYLDGNEDYITIPHSPSLRVTTHTVELWFKTNGEFSQRYTKIIRTSQSRYPYSISLTSQRSIYHFWHSEKTYHDHTTAACIQWGQWHHVAITNDGKLSSIYVDGELQKQTPTEGISDDKTLSEILIGKDYNKSYPIEFKGWITEVRLWNKARSQEEIKENMSRCLSGNETGLVGYWPLVKALTANNIAIDKSQNKNNGKINGASIANIELPSSFAEAQLNAEERWANQNQIELNNLTKAARTGSALYLDGSEDYITIPQSPSLKVTTHTVELWFKTNGAFSQSYTGIIRTTQSKFPYSIALTSDKKIGHSWYSEKKSCGQSTPVCIEWGQWHHLAITNDGKLSSIYVDGELKKQTPTEGVYDDENLSEILIGKHLSESYPIEFKGWITEVRLWNKARSGEEIKENMSRCLSGNETGLVGYWPLVKALTATNIAIDKSPNENNGKINGASIAKIELPSSFAKAQLNAEERWAHQNQDELNKLQVTLEKAKEEANIARKEKAAKEDEIKILNGDVKKAKEEADIARKEKAAKEDEIKILNGDVKKAKEEADIARKEKTAKEDEIKILNGDVKKAKEEADIARKEKAAKEDEIKILNDKIKTLKDQLAAKGGTEHTEVVKAAPPKQVTLHEGDNFDENKDPFLPGDHSLGRSPKTSTTGLEDYARWKTLFQDHEQDPNAKPFRRGRIWS